MQHLHDTSPSPEHGILSCPCWPPFTLSLGSFVPAAGEAPLRSRSSRKPTPALLLLNKHFLDLSRDAAHLPSVQAPVLLETVDQLLTFYPFQNLSS